MSGKRIAQIIGGIVVGVAIAFGAMKALERAITPQAPPPLPESTAPAPASAAHITATLFYGSEDGQTLVPVRREVPLADGVVAQGRQIVTMQLQAPPMPYLSVIPAGTTLRAFYVTERGDAIVDVSGQISKGHPGGTFAELMTVDAIVDAVTANLQKVQRVQILIDGKEVDTLAGHVDIRRPLQRDNSLVKQ
jgi:hypothetical protein